MTDSVGVKIVVPVEPAPAVEQASSLFGVPLVNGGPGSGNFGHSGVPGQVGGSGGGGGASSPSAKGDFVRMESPFKEGKKESFVVVSVEEDSVTLKEVMKKEPKTFTVSKEKADEAKGAQERWDKAGETLKPPSGLDAAAMGLPLRERRGLLSVKRPTDRSARFATPSGVSAKFGRPT